MGRAVAESVSDVVEGGDDLAEPIVCRADVCDRERFEGAGAGDPSGDGAQSVTDRRDIVRGHAEVFGPYTLRLAEGLVNGEPAVHELHRLEHVAAKSTVANLPEARVGIDVKEHADDAATLVEGAAVSLSRGEKFAETAAEVVGHLAGPPWRRLVAAGAEVAEIAADPQDQPSEPVADQQDEEDPRHAD